MTGPSPHGSVEAERTVGDKPLGGLHLDLNRIDLNPGPVATYFEHLAHENTTKSRAILVWKRIRLR